MVVDVKSSFLWHNLGRHLAIHSANKNSSKFNLGSAAEMLMLLSLSLPEPHFLHAVDYGDFVYFFFREIAAEHNNLGKV